MQKRQAIVREDEGDDEEDGPGYGSVQVLDPQCLPTAKEQQDILRPAIDRALGTGIKFQAISANMGLRPAELQDIYEGRGVRDPEKWETVAMYLKTRL